MKKCSILLAAVILFLTAMPVQAVAPWTTSVSPTISFNESTAACSVGMSDVIKYKTISGSAVFYASSQYTLNATANNG